MLSVITRAASRRMPLWRVAFATIAAFLLIGATADARPRQNLADLRTQAAEVRAEIERLDQEAAVAVERYNLARAELDAANALLVTARRDLARAEEERDLAQGTLAVRLSLIYKSEELSLLDIIFSAADMTDLADGLEAIERIHGADAETADDLAATAERIATLTSTLEHERAAALDAEVAVREHQADVEDQLARRQRLLDDVDARIKHILELRAKREAERARRLARRAGVDLNNIAGSAAQRALVSETARYLGTPYVWGGASPSQGFDCSGLVMYVYRKFGVGLLHGATLQARGGTPVPLSRLEPADLVFFGDASFYRHVGIYIGDGLFIEAPRTGDVVKVSKLAGRDCAFACRYPIRQP